jgi:hypothetical protein
MELGLVDVAYADLKRTIELKPTHEIASSLL